MVVNNSTFVPKSMAVAFQPAQQIMKMVSTINNNLAIRQDSFAKSAKLEKQMRMMMLTEGNEQSEAANQAESANPALPAGMTIKTMSPTEARLQVIDSATQLLGQAKDYVSVIQKHEALLADQSTSEEQRTISTKLVGSLKKELQGVLAGTLYMQSTYIGWFGKAYDRENKTNGFAEMVELTGDTSAETLGLTGFASMNSEEILEKLDGALAHLNEMGKLVNPAYTPPEIAPVPQKELDRFERIAESWDYITGKLVDGVPKEPMEKTTLNIYA